MGALEWIDLSGTVDYAEALAVQEARAAAIRAGEAGEAFYLLEHDPVYTIGRTSDRSSLRQPALLPHPVHEIGRGGQATYHGPGQLTGYLLIDLAQRGKDLHRYLRMLEDVLIQTTRAFGVEADRRDGLTGVWVEDRKLASIGVGVRRWVTLHGFGYNLTREALDGFQAITPCGIDDVRMTCLEAEAGEPSSRAAFAAALRPVLEEEVGRLQG